MLQSAGQGHQPSHFHQGLALDVGFVVSTISHLAGSDDNCIRLAEAGGIHILVNMLKLFRSASEAFNAERINSSDDWHGVPQLRSADDVGTVADRLINDDKPDFSGLASPKDEVRHAPNLEVASNVLRLLTTLSLVKGIDIKEDLEHGFETSLDLEALLNFFATTKFAGYESTVSEEASRCLCTLDYEDDKGKYMGPIRPESKTGTGSVFISYAWRSSPKSILAQKPGKTSKVLGLRSEVGHIVSDRRGHALPAAQIH